MLPAFISAVSDGCTLALKVQPRAKRDGFAGEHGGELKVQVTAPPVDSAANEAVVELVAATVRCPKSAVTIIRGETSRHKVVHLRGVSAEAVAAAVRTQAG